MIRAVAAAGGLGLVLAGVIGGTAPPTSGAPPTAAQAYPPLGLAESSGMAASAQHPEVIWVVEDGALDQSAAPVVHAYGPAGDELATVTLAGWNNRDVEAMAIGPGPTIWVADIGDNSRLRETVVVHTFAEPADLGPTTVEPVSYRLRYPDGAHDAEAILVDPLDGRLYVLTKSPIGSGSLYAAPRQLTPGGTHDVELVGTVRDLVSDAAFTPDGSRVVVLRDALLLDNELLVHDVVRRDDTAPVELGADPVSLALPRQAQPESVTVVPDGSAVLVGSEGLDEPIWRVALPPSGPGPDEPATTTGSTSSVRPGTPPAGAPGRSTSGPDPERFVVAAIALGAGLVALLAVLRRRRASRSDV